MFMVLLGRLSQDALIIKLSIVFTLRQILATLPSQLKFDFPVMLRSLTELTCLRAVPLSLLMGESAQAQHDKALLLDIFLNLIPCHFQYITAQLCSGQPGGLHNSQKIILLVDCYTIFREYLPTLYLI